MLIYLLELTVYDPGAAGTATLRYASGGGYNQASNYYAPRIKDVVEYTVSLSADPRTGGPQIAAGSITLKDDDQALKAAFAPYGIAGFAATLLLGDDTAAYGTFTTLLSAKMADPTFDATTVTLNFQDRSQDLQVPLAKSTFAGTNSLPTGTEGTANDVGGQYKPVAYGRVRQIQAPNVNTSRAVDQVHDGQVSSLVAGRDKGVAITKGSSRSFANIDVAGEPTAGQFDYFVGDGTHGAYARRVSSLASAGPFTYDVDGDARGSTFRTAPADLAKEIVEQRVTSGPSTVAGDVTALNAATTAVLGFWNRDNVMVSDVVGQIMVSAGAKWWLDTTGFRMAQLTAPSGSEVASLRRLDLTTTRGTTDADIVSWKILPPDVPIVWKVTVRYQRYWLAQTQGLDANIDQALRGQLQNEWRSSVTSDSSVLTQYPAAVEITIDTLLDAKADADTLAAAILALLKVRRDYILADLQCSATVAALISAPTALVKTYGLMDYSTTGRLQRVLGYSAYDQQAGILRNVKVFG